MLNRNQGSASLQALFRPQSVAVIGASSNILRFGGRPIDYMKRAEYAGPIYPVNPSRDEIQGLRAYPSIGAIGAPVDCAIVSVPTGETVAAVRNCAEAGVKAAIVFSAGFAEHGLEGRTMQDEMVATARASGMRLLGPNCMGAFHAGHRFYGTFTVTFEESIPPSGNVGLVSQSGGYGGYVLRHAAMREVGVAAWATTGNEADIDAGELMRYMAGDDEIEVIVTYLEGLRNGAAFIDGLASARAAGKPVVAMKVGRTEEGRVAAASHTASLTGEDAIYDAVFEEFGVIRARTSRELLDMTYALSRGRRPRGKRVGVVSISGGVGVQICDYVADVGLTLGSTPDTLRAELTALVPAASTRNPIDMTGLVTMNHDLMEKTMDATLASGAFDAVVVFLGVCGMTPSMAHPLRDVIARSQERHPDALVLLSVTAPEEEMPSYTKGGMLAFEDPSDAIAALSALWRAPHPGSLPKAPVPGPALDPPPEGGRLDEARAKVLLAGLGLHPAREEFATDPAGAAAAAERIGGAVALKIVSPDIAHKTEAGGVALRLTGAEAVRAAAEEMLLRVAGAVPGARLEGFLVSEMVTDGVEMLLGLTRDPVFGPIVTLGAGGTLVELMKDTRIARAPVSADTARAMVLSLKTAPLLKGWRGSASLDLEAFARAVAAISSAFAATPRIATIEVNPIVVRTQDIVVLDAVIETTDPPREDPA